MKKIIAFLTLLLLLSCGRSQETRFLQMRCAPNCLFGNVCGDNCQCIWPNCVEKRGVEATEGIPEQDKQNDVTMLVGPMLGFGNTLENCVCNRGDVCCCPPKMKCCNTPGRCCCMGVKDISELQA